MRVYLKALCFSHILTPQKPTKYSYEKTSQARKLIISY